VPAQARRISLIQACGETTGVVVELGCAGGRNLEALGTGFPDAHVIGIDVSTEALASAVRRTEHLPKVRVAHVHQPREAALVRDLQDGIDVLVLSEVITRLGGARGINDALVQFAPLLRAGARVVMADRARGCDGLHRVAARALDVPIVLSRHPADSAGAYTLTVAALPVPLLSFQ
jgi:precorrin-6B methylase 2